MKSRVDSFLKELAELSKKYDIEIWGCGCCGSPSLMNISDGKTLADDLNWEEEEDKYSVEYADTVLHPEKLF